MAVRETTSFQGRRSCWGAATGLVAKRGKARTHAGRSSRRRTEGPVEAAEAGSVTKASRSAEVATPGQVDEPGRTRTAPTRGGVPGGRWWKALGLQPRGSLRGELCEAGPWSAGRPSGGVSRLPSGPVDDEERLGEKPGRGRCAETCAASSRVAPSWCAPRSSSIGVVARRHRGREAAGRDRGSC